jgi:hypothetical protein
LHLRSMRTLVKDVLFSPIDSGGPQVDVGAFVNDCFLPLAILLTEGLVDLCSIASAGAASQSLLPFSSGASRVLSAVVAVAMSLWPHHHLSEGLSTSAPRVQREPLVYLIGHCCYYGSNESREMSLTALNSHIVSIQTPQSTTENNGDPNASELSNSSEPEGTISSPSTVSTSTLTQGDIGNVFIPLFAPLAGEKDKTIRGSACRIVQYLLGMLMSSTVGKDDVNLPSASAAPPVTLAKCTNSCCRLDAQQVVRQWTPKLAVSEYREHLKVWRSNRVLHPMTENASERAGNHDAIAEHFMLWWTKQLAHSIPSMLSHSATNAVELDQQSSTLKTQLQFPQLLPHIVHPGPTGPEVRAPPVCKVPETHDQALRAVHESVWGLGNTGTAEAAALRRRHALASHLLPQPNY